MTMPSPPEVGLSLLVTWTRIVLKIFALPHTRGVPLPTTPSTIAIDCQNARSEPAHHPRSRRRPPQSESRRRHEYARRSRTGHRWQADQRRYGHSCAEDETANRVVPATGTTGTHGHDDCFSFQP